MANTEHSSLSLHELLDAANKHYSEHYLSEYFAPATAAAKGGSGDSLAEFIVRELRDTFNEKSTRSEQIKSAVSALKRASKDIEDAIVGLRELI